MYFTSKEVVGGANVEYGNEAASRQSLCQRITFLVEELLGLGELL